MADAAIDLKLVDDLFLPYEAGAEQWLDADLAALWAAVTAAFPGLTLNPLIASVDVETIIDLTDMARMLGNEPPNILGLFTIPCEVEWIEALLPVIRDLPFVLWADTRAEPLPPNFVSYGTNPRAHASEHLRPMVLGHDVFHAWRVEGGTGTGVQFVDVEYDFDPTHEEFVGAGLQPFSYFKPVPPNQGYVDHGTASLGLVMAQDNGTGSVGIAPDVNARFCSQTRADGKVKSHEAVFTGAIGALPHGILLVEMAHSYPPGNGPDVMVETSLPMLDVIRFATALGVTVIEPAGNAGVDLDTIPLAGPDHSGAVVVGGGAHFQPPNSGDILWSRQPPGTTGGSSFGKRVDCFSAYVGVTAPGGPTANSYWTGINMFGGTSAASAIIAGLACSIQGMALARGGPLQPADIRRLLSSPALGDYTAPSQPGGVGVMPDLKRITHDQGWARIVPYGLAPGQGSDVLSVAVDESQFISGAAWTTSPAGKVRDRFAGTGTFLATQTPAISVARRRASLRWTDVAAVSSTGAVHHLAWRNGKRVGNFDVERAGYESLARGHDIAVVRSGKDILVAAGVSPEGLLVSMSGTSKPNLVTDFSAPKPIDLTLTFRKCPGPQLLMRKSNKAEIIAIDDNGIMRFAETTPVTKQGDLTWSFASPFAQHDYSPGAKPGFVGIEDQGVAIVGIGADRHLYSWVLSLPLSETVDIFPDMEFSTSGPVGLALAGDTLVAAAVGTDGLVYAAFRRLEENGGWFMARPVDSSVQVSRLGGAQVVVQANAITVLAILPDGRPCRADHYSNVGWTHLEP
jgi:hypothetical protein